MQDVSLSILKWGIILTDPDGPNVFTGERDTGRSQSERENLRTKPESREHAMLLALKTEEGATSQGM